MTSARKCGINNGKADIQKRKTLRWSVKTCLLSHDQDTIHAENGCAEIHDLYLTALMFLTGHGIRARTHSHVEITHFPTWCTTRTWTALGLRLRASHALMMLLVGKMCNFRMDMGSSYNVKYTFKTDCRTNCIFALRYHSYYLKMQRIEIRLRYCKVVHPAIPNKYFA